MANGKSIYIPSPEAYREFRLLYEGGMKKPDIINHIFNRFGIKLSPQDATSMTKSMKRKPATARSTLSEEGERRFIQLWTETDIPRGGIRDILKAEFGLVYSVDQISNLGSNRGLVRPNSLRVGKNRQATEYEKNMVEQISEPIVRAVPDQVRRTSEKFRVPTGGYRTAATMGRTRA
jgi:hypothetical protein